MEPFINASPEQIKQFAALPLNTPFQMLNLLKYKDHVEGSDKTGKEQYQEYMEAAAPFFSKSQGRVLYSGSSQATLIGPIENQEWDKVLLVEYPSKETFLEMITTEGYPAKLRAAALADSRLICLFSQ